MASYTKRGNSYRIRASVGYTLNGSQVQPSMTWTPEPGMTERQIEKELNRQMVLFDEECQGGRTGGHNKFEDFGQQWFREYAELRLGKRTVSNYRQLSTRAYAALGHLYMDKISPRQIQKFINSLGENGANQSQENQGLSPKYIKNHLSFVSTIFAYAVKMDMLKENPCHRVTLPSMEYKEKSIYTIEETQAFLNALEAAPLRWKVFFCLAIYGGYRREELYGFEFKDFDFEGHTATVSRASLYDPQNGIFTAPTKTVKSRRTLKLPGFLFDLVKALRAEQAARRLALGDQWQESDRLFTKQDGTPARQQDAYDWLSGFCKECHLPFYGIHQFRHLNASLLISNNEDIRTVSAALGHSQTSTTLNIYAHAFQTAQARASEALADRLPVKFGKKA